MNFLQVVFRSEDDKDDTDNRANQLNPNNDAYHSSRAGNDDDDE